VELVPEPPKIQILESEPQISGCSAIFFSQNVGYPAGRISGKFNTGIRHIPT